MDTIIFTPSRSWVENLQVGDMAIDYFGRLMKVTDVTFRGNDIHGKAYVGYYTEFNHNSKISHSAKEGEVISTLPITSKYHTIWNIPRELIVESDTIGAVNND